VYPVLRVNLNEQVDMSGTTSNATTHAPFLVHDLTDEFLQPFLDTPAEHTASVLRAPHTTRKAHWKTASLFDRSVTRTSTVHSSEIANGRSHP
jgi:hypothetical protein